MIDLDGYLARIGVPARAPSLAALDELHEAHVRAFTFDNIDVLLEQHPGVAPEAVSAKFVGRGRGGYCFEHATLFWAALQLLGYDAARHLGRVGDPASSAARTHCVAHVRVDGATRLADPGFGMSPLRTLPLIDGAEADHDGWRYRVRRAEDETWEAYRWREERWELMHTHDESPAYPVDLVMGHHFTSTFPASHFRHGLMVTRFLPGRHVSVAHDTLTVRRPGQPTEHRSIALDELPGLLAEVGVPFADGELARLLAVCERF